MRLIEAVEVNMANDEGTKAKCLFCNRMVKVKTDTLGNKRFTFHKDGHGATCKGWRSRVDECQPTRQLSATVPTQLASPQRIDLCDLPEYLASHGLARGYVTITNLDPLVIEMHARSAA